MDIMGLIVAILVAAIVIWIVGKLGLGIEIDGYVGAIVAAIVIALVAWAIYWLLGLFNFSLGQVGDPILNAIIMLVVAAVVLLISDRFVPGMKVKGFGGAIIAAISIAVVIWLVDWVLALIIT